MKNSDYSISEENEDGATLDAPTPTDQYEHISIGLPPYVVDQLRTKTIADKSSMRFEIMRALRRVGYDIHKADLVKDGRRGKFIRKRAS